MKLLNIETLFTGNWLNILQATFLDKYNNKRKWEFVERKGKRKVVTMICRSPSSGKILLIKQPRIPIDSVEISFPAGLVDENETIEEAALRELKEETGYNVRILHVSNPLPKSAGMSSESTSLVFCEVEENEIGKTRMDATEEITSEWVDPADFQTFLEEIDHNNEKLALEVYSFIKGYLFALEMKD